MAPNFGKFRGEFWFGEPVKHLYVWELTLYADGKAIRAANPEAAELMDLIEEIQDIGIAESDEADLHSWLQRARRNGLITIGEHLALQMYIRALPRFM